MRNLSFARHILPHIAAVLVFLGVTVAFFKPLFLDNKSLEQHDIRQFVAVSKSLKDYRAQTGEEGLWASSLFSGMPAYLVNVHWGSVALSWVKRIFAFGLPHPVRNVYWAFLAYYILLLAFGLRPGLAIAGALAFGLSSYMIIGMAAGHNSRIGAVAYIPLVVAGIHLIFSDRKWLGVGITALGMALQLRENHLQITYYLLLILLLYGLVQLVIAARNRAWRVLGTRVGLSAAAVSLAVGSFLASFWATFEYSQYSIRGPSELAPSDDGPPASGLNRDYAFAYSNGIAEPMTLLIPNFYGGSSTDFLVQDTESAVYQVLSRQSDNRLANTLARYTSSYWGPQPFTSPYYAGAVVFFLFMVGALWAPQRHRWWLISITALGIVLSWGSHFASFNYFLFDYLPGYNKFRSVTFAILMPLFAMPLLGLLGLEKLLDTPFTKDVRKKLLWAFLASGGLCIAFLLFAGVMDFSKAGEGDLPLWFSDALHEDRKGMLQQDAFRSLVFVTLFVAILYLALREKISHRLFFLGLILLMVSDLFAVDRRYFNEANYTRKGKAYRFTALPVDEAIRQDTSYYRVYDLQEPWGQEGRTCYFHHSINGYHAAKLRRYQDFYDSCLQVETQRLMDDARNGRIDFTRYRGLNMLNVKYIVFGPEKEDFMVNTQAGGAAWFVESMQVVNSPEEELAATCSLHTAKTAVLDASRFTPPQFAYDSLSRVSLSAFSPPYMSYTTQSKTDGLAVFSEIFYPKGWRAFVDGKETPILRVNYLLRAVAVPAGRHNVEFRFEPQSYVVGRRITAVCTWATLLLALGSIGWRARKALF